MADSDRDTTGEEKQTPLRLGRRAALAGVAAVGIATAGGVHLLLASAEPSGNGQSGAIGPLTAGAAIESWTVVAVHPVLHGAVPLVLATDDGQRYQVDVLARDPAGPQGVANTETLSLFVSNRGDGARPTDEDQGLGALAVARALGAYERRADANLPRLLTFSERSAQHPGGSFGVPLT